MIKDLKKLSTKEKSIESVNKHMENCLLFIRKALIGTKNASKYVSWLSCFCNFQIDGADKCLHLEHLYIKLNIGLFLG